MYSIDNQGSLLRELECLSSPTCYSLSTRDFLAIGDGTKASNFLSKTDLFYVHVHIS